MTLLHLVESWAEGLLRIVIGTGLMWIGVAEGAGYGAFLAVVGAIIIVAGVAGIVLDAMPYRLPRQRAGSDMNPALIACDVPIFYATTNGQTRRIADRLAALFHDQGFTSRALDVAGSDARHVDWLHVQAAVVGASLRAQRHQRSAEAFVRQHAEDLNRHPSVFFSVSLAAASESPAERRAAAEIASQLPARSHWHPDHVVCFGGRLAYTKYGWLTRFIMKRIARQHGAPIDTSRDHEFTNWEEVGRLAHTVGRTIGAGASRNVA